MTTIFLMIFFLIFTTINADTSPSKKNTNCQCLSNDLNDIKVCYNSYKGASFTIKIKSWSDLQIDCKYMEGWNYFDFTSEQSEKKLNSLEFKHCELPNTTTLKNVVKKLGVENTNILIFQSFKDLGETLKREHLQEFSNVKKLVLSHNGLTNISYDLFLDLLKLEYLDISQNNLILHKDVFEGTPNLKRLELYGNDMKELVPDLFYNLDYLEFLNLRRNALKELNVEIFDELSSLKNLNLGINSLSELPQLIFKKLKRLETINLSFNNFNYIPSKLFDRNKKLRQVILHDNKVPISTLPDNLLSNLKNLEEVFLSNNGFINLTENLFWGSSSLKYINLNVNFLKTLPQNIFRDLQNVEQLLISNNLIDTLPEKIFKDLRKLKILNLSMNRIVSISRNLFEGLTSLTELNMERNHLKHIDHTALSAIRNLTIAKFSHNQLQLSLTSTKQSPFINNYLLKELHLSHNGIQDFFSDWSISKPFLIFLDLRHNNISTISASNFILSSNNIVVDLRYNKIRNILLKEIEDLATDQTEERDVVILVEHNPLLCDCKLYDLLRYYNDDMPISVYNYIEIRVVNLKCIHRNGVKGPQINELDLTTYKCPEEDYFKIEKNCQIGCICSIRPKDRTRILDCSYKNMSVFLIDQAKINFLGKYPLILNLTGNFLTEAPSIETLKPINVTGLLLSNNNITEITFDKLSKNLTVLELHNNNISKFDKHVMDYLLSSSFTELTLSGNPLICDCDSKYLLEFVQLKRSYYKDLNNLKCKNMDIPMYTMTFKQLCDKEEELKKKCPEVSADF